MCHHHEYVFAKMSLKVKHPPPYEQILWNYTKADKISKNRRINSKNWRNFSQVKK